ncbi:DNA polymerase I [Nymphon striatum]|nr:DNA polymerase I [Nymphon striatum]
MRQGKIYLKKLVRKALNELWLKTEGRNDFQIGFIAINKKGETGGYCIQPGIQTWYFHSTIWGSAILYGPLYKNLLQITMIFGSNFKKKKALVRTMIFMLVFGMILGIYKIFQSNPDHLAVCFDKGGSQERTDLFPEYKANRSETPDAIKIAKAGRPDDIIGTLAKQAEKEDYKARMGNGIEIWGIPEIQKRFGVERPEQVIDYLGMMGDASDNIPGLPGVGDKTARKFIA